MFDEEDERVLVVLATQAAIAVENARLYDETERKGRELQRLQVLEERERIGKELHDGVIQSLFAVGMSLQGLASSSGDAEHRSTPRGGRRGCRSGDPGPAQLHLRSPPGDPGRPTARPGAQGDGDRVRSTLGRRDGRRRRRRGRVRARLPRRRGGAARARGALERQPARRRRPRAGSRSGAERSGIVLEIDDDGRGFDVRTTTWGMGLRNLRERAETLGGRLEIESTPGRRDDRPGDVPVLSPADPSTARFGLPSSDDRAEASSAPGHARGRSRGRAGRDPSDACIGGRHPRDGGGRHRPARRSMRPTGRDPMSS